MPREGIYYSLPEENLGYLEGDFSLSKGDMALERGFRMQYGKDVELHKALDSFDSGAQFLLTVIAIMYQSNRSFNMPPSPPRASSQAFEFLEFFFESLPCRAKKLFKSPVIGLFQVIPECPHNYQITVLTFQ